MSENQAQEKTTRKARTLEQEITLQRDRLRRLEERQREQQRKDREKNQKAVLELIHAEKLDAVAAAQWHKALPAIRAALLLLPTDTARTPPSTPTVDAH